MRIALQMFVVASSIAFSGCDYFEAQRVISQSENELGVKFSVRPEMLQSESYGWAEEGGDRTLLHLNAADCAMVAKRLPETDPVGVESSRMFAAAGAVPALV